MKHFSQESALPFSAQELAHWHHLPGVIHRLTPPWQKVTPLQISPIVEGSRTRVQLHLPCKKILWEAAHFDCRDDGSFSDRQLRGPFRHWEHSHRFHPIDAHHCRLNDSIDYQIPGGRVGQFLLGGKIARDLKRAFLYRHLQTLLDITRHRPYFQARAQHILLTGATGFIGRALEPLLTMLGHRVTALTRHPREPNQIAWNPMKGDIDREALERTAPFDAVIHLAGENIAAKRWSARQKKRLRRSRIDSARLLIDYFSETKSPPTTFITASGIHAAQAPPGQWCDEANPRATDFLGRLCQDWEEASRHIQEQGTRWIALRLAMVIDPRGGALAKMLPLFRLGLGGPVGDGRNYWSWIALDDVIDLVLYALHHSNVSGIIHAASPQPLTSSEFATTLGRVLHRPAILPAPKPAILAALGEMGRATLLHDLRAHSERLESLSYCFRFSQLEPALRHLLGKENCTPPAQTVNS